ncbi:hypothetical protein LIA77_08572 [Sarocladium implicatum]|nr:hypothetical protein LIA77_08572 [Sarocladium implicatum]
MILIQCEFIFEASFKAPPGFHLPHAARETWPKPPLCQKRGLSSMVPMVRPGFAPGTSCMGYRGFVVGLTLLFSPSHPQAGPTKHD